MNTKPDDGGPAFPITRWGRTQAGEVAQESEGGMSLRDYFAAKAMQGLLADSCVQRGCYGWPNDRDEFNAAVANSAYAKADAMIAARSATSQNGGAA